jgi:hypothetical protein
MAVTMSSQQLGGDVRIRVLSCANKKLDIIVACGVTA